MVDGSRVLVGWRVRSAGRRSSVVDGRWSVAADRGRVGWSLPFFHVAQLRCKQQLLFLPRGLDLRHQCLHNIMENYDFNSQPLSTLKFMPKPK
jgi:hypothetical protein